MTVLMTFPSPIPISAFHAGFIESVHGGNILEGSGWYSPHESVHRGNLREGSGWYTAHELPWLKTTFSYFLVSGWPCVVILNIKFRRNPWRSRLQSLDSRKGSRHQADDIGGRLTAKTKLYFTPFLRAGSGKGRLGSMFKQRDQLFP